MKANYTYSLTKKALSSTEMNIQKVIYLNCGKRYEDMIDPRSFTRNLSSCEIKA